MDAYDREIERLSDKKIHIVPRLKTTFGSRCKHYKGTGSMALTGRIVPFEEQVCSAGVRLVDVSIKGEWKYRYEGRDNGGPAYTSGRCEPCHSDYNFAGAKCDKAEFPTEQEVADWLEKINKRVAYIGVARKAIIEHLKDGYGSGTIDCPACKSGKLGFSRSSYNGHVHAKCTTDDCVGWME